MSYYRIEIDITNVGEENINIVCSPWFETEEEANSWYRELTYIYDYCDIILVKYNETKDKIEDTTLY